MMGLSTSGSISLGWALVAGRKRVPNPAAGKIALRTFWILRRSPLARRSLSVICDRSFVVSRWLFALGCQTIVLLVFIPDARLLRVLPVPQVNRAASAIFLRRWLS